ncbi:MAG: hypothetical protein A2W91_15475 [Bacteroidetes bacterium GWF2_38_335]|nr:MAG: hypothetical protein A2W91_15475 [Bacteroidetes bacterium GWF2_38_335]OFY81496.1 MAG: hypothetical protein A2281_11335 [Bacteroidetes bacterium RIFOXYA12_FULL_38_20]HBS87663.1 hypothetical protein [Bacteroidales bacterium]
MQKLFLTGVLIFLLTPFINSQNTNSNITGEFFTGDINTITTAVPFLMIAPDSRAGAMGDVGVATSPDANSMHWNPAKYAFAEEDMSLSISYTPWLRQLVNDINLAYVSGYKKMDKRQVIGVSLLYFSLGDITFTDNNGSTIGQFKPNEFSLDGAYSRLFGEHLSGSVSLRYIYSNLTGGQFVQGIQSHAGQAVSADVSTFYTKEIQMGDRDGNMAFGLNISNIGSKISYTENQERDFIPINLRLGAALTTEMDDYNKLTFAMDINRLMVPTPPVYDGIGREPENIIAGKDPNVSIPVGMFRSFNDAPGVIMADSTRNVFKEEMREMNYAVGAEYWYSDQFAIRGGYFYEHETKGNRKYFTLGLGLRLKVFGLDFAYLIPQKQNNPLANTLRFTLIFNFDGLKNETN